MKRYADRGFIAINGVEVAELVSSTMTRSTNRNPKETMTRDYTNGGTTRGNTTITLDLELAITVKQAQLDLALVDEDASISAVYECGGERYTVIGLFETEMTISSSVGDASKSIKLGALKVVNENGDNVNAILEL